MHALARTGASGEAMTNSARVRPTLAALGALLGLAAHGCSSTSGSSSSASGSLNRIKAQSFGAATQRGSFAVISDETKRKGDLAVQRALFTSMRERGFTPARDPNAAGFIIMYEYEFTRESIMPLETSFNFGGAPGGGGSRSIGTTAVTHLSIDVLKFHTTGRTRSPSLVWQVLASIEDPDHDVAALAPWLVPMIFEHFGRTIDPAEKLEPPAGTVKPTRRDPKLPRHL